MADRRLTKPRSAPHQSTAWLALSAICVLLLAGCANRPRSITEDRLGKLDEIQVDFTVSPNGLRYAYITKRGGAPRIIIDGEVGPDYADVVKGSLTFSPDSSRFLYAATDGDRFFVVADGEEGERFDAVTGPRPRFSPDARRLAYVAGREGGLCVVVDSAVGPRYDAILDLCFSPDGKRTAYVGVRDGLPRVAIDHKPDEPYDGTGVDSLRFSPDSRHVSYAAEKGDRWFVVVDGDESMPVDALGSVWRWSPDGTRLAYTFDLNGHHDIGVASPVGEVPTPTDVDYDTVLDDSITFSPGGAALAFVVKLPKGRSVVTHREAGPVYDTIDPLSLTFSDDGEHFAYVAERDAMDRVVLDGQEGPEYDNILGLRFRPGSDQVGYVAARGKLAYVVIGDIEGEPCEGVLPDGVVFSPDGQRVGYGARLYSKWAIILDGKQRTEHVEMRDGSLTWSADSAHFAYIAEGPEGSRVVLDAQPGPIYGSIAPGGPTFAPDGSVQYVTYIGDVVYRITQSPS